MKITEIPIDQLHEASWNPNFMPPELLVKLRESIEEFGIVANLVVRPSSNGYEVLSGNQRLKMYREMDLEVVPCVIVGLSDGKAKLLAQVLNCLEGEDDLAKRADVMRSILDELPQDEVLALLPDSASDLAALLEIDQVSVRESLELWEKAQQAKLRELVVHLRQDQIEIVKEALKTAEREVSIRREPNTKAACLVHVCRKYLCSIGAL